MQRDAAAPRPCTRGLAGRTAGAHGVPARVLRSPSNQGAPAARAPLCTAAACVNRVAAVWHRLQENCMNATAPTTRLEHRQHQALTPRLQHAVRLLQLSSLDFAQEVQEAMGKNPFLEQDDSAPGDSAGTGSEAVGAGALSPPAETVSVEPPSASDMAADTWERDSWQQAPARSSMSSSGGGDGDAAMMEMVAADVSLREYLYSQVNVLPLSDRDRVLVGAIIESLDDDGYLRTSLDELAAMSELEPAVEDCEMSTALKLVQSLDPPGIAACSVSDCLRLQLPVIEEETERELALYIF